MIFERYNKLKICNITLLLVALPMLISSIQMEVCGGKPLANFGFAEYMAIHGKIGFVFLSICIGHIIKRWWWFKKNAHK